MTFLSRNNVTFDDFFPHKSMWLFFLKKFDILYNDFFFEVFDMLNYYFFCHEITIYHAIAFLMTFDDFFSTWLFSWKNLTYYTMTFSTIFFNILWLYYDCFSQSCCCSQTLNLFSSLLLSADTQVESSHPPPPFSPPSSYPVPGQAQKKSTSHLIQIFIILFKSSPTLVSRPQGRFPFLLTALLPP